MEAMQVEQSDLVHAISGLWRYSDVVPNQSFCSTQYHLDLSHSLA